MMISLVKTETARAYNEALNEAVKHLLYDRSRVGSGEGGISDVRTSHAWMVPTDSTLGTMCHQIFQEALNKYLAGIQYVKPDVSRNEGYQLLRYRKREKYDVHIDESAQNGRRVSAILYLNDSYEGGEISFPLHKKKIKPKAGTVLLFPSNYAFPHASLPIKSGEKYSVVTWFS